MLPSSSGSGGFYLKSFALSITLLKMLYKLIKFNLYILAIYLANVDLPDFALPTIRIWSGGILAKFITSSLKGFYNYTGI